MSKLTFDMELTLTSASGEEVEVSVEFGANRLGELSIEDIKPDMDTLIQHHRIRDAEQQIFDAGYDRLPAELEGAEIDAAMDRRD